MPVMPFYGLARCCVFYFASTSVVSATDDPSALDSILFAVYNPNVPPGDDLSKTPVHVNIGMSLTRIIHMDEDTQIAQTNVWLRWQWNDSRLTWDPKTFGNITTYVTTSKAWMPDVTLYNDVRKSARFQDKRDVRLMWDATVQWQSPITYYTNCQSDTFFFPFEQLRCRFKFGSWAYHGGEMHIMPMNNSASTETFFSHAEWQLVEMTTFVHNNTYKCCPNKTFPDVTFVVVLQRQGVYYLTTLLLPVFSMLLLACFSFHLPAGNGEKATLAVMIYLTQMVFYVVVNQILPKHWNITFLGIFLMMAEGELLLATVLNIVVVHIHFRGKFGIAAPSWLHDVVFLKLSRFFNLSDTVAMYQEKQHQVASIRQMSLGSTETMEFDREVSVTAVGPDGHKNTENLESNDNFQVQNMILNQFVHMSDEMYIRAKVKSIRLEWALMAMIIDRVCFYIYLGTICEDVMQLIDVVLLGTLLASTAFVDGRLPTAMCDYVKYDQARQICCNNNLYKRTSATEACCNSRPFYPSTQICCFDKVLDKKSNPFCAEYFYP
ncbi:Neuronal acetylcholine receptor subunit alpha-2 [Lamellibrachia satsuma]|nr:Neuronal acetylcholine receptor subunit alpha-2 [Lamellibrachia satsuma]